jgi:hypothetical protein
MSGGMATTSSLSLVERAGTDRGSGVFEVGIKSVGRVYGLSEMRPVAGVLFIPLQDGKHSTKTSIRLMKNNDHLLFIRIYLPDIHSSEINAYIY